MPLGKISKGQIAKGFDALEEIEKELNAKRTAKLAELSSEFYTVIPHDFGRQRPPAINSAEDLQKKKDMLMVRLCRDTPCQLHRLRWVVRRPVTDYFDDYDYNYSMS